VVSAEIIQALQTIISRQIDITKAPAIITVGKIQSGVRANIIPEEAFMEGTIRTLDDAMQKDIHARIKHTAEKIAEANGATAEVMIDTKTLVTYNDPQLVAKSLASLQKAAGGAENVLPINWQTGAEDFSFYGKKAPSFFFNVGARSPKITVEESTSHHAPAFMLDDSRLDVGMRAFVQLVLDFAKNNK
jgi:amidohydrolase